MNINKTWERKNINIEIGNRGNLTGTMTNKAGTHKVTRITVVQGKKVMPFFYKGKPAFQILPDSIYNEIDEALRLHFEATEEEKIQEEIEIAKRQYYKALNIGPVEANKWLDKWNNLSDQLQAID